MSQIPFTPVQQGTNVVPPPFPTDGSMPTYAVDFETYYDKVCSVRPLGNYHYCRHPQFDAYLVSVYGPGVCYVGHPRFAPWDKIKGKGFRWLSHNASFDEEVQLYLIEAGIIPADSLPEEWCCTADLAAYLGGPRSLKGALKWFHKKEISKETRNKMEGKRWSEMTPEFQSEVLAYAMDDAVECRDDLWVQFEKQWPEHERQISALTRRMGRRGLKVDLTRLNNGITALDAVKVRARGLLPWAPEDLDTDKGVLAPKHLKALCKENGIEAPSSLAKDSLECAEWEDKYGDLFPWVGAMRDFRRANALGKKFRTMLQRVKPDGRMTFSLKYFGASITGRWSGDGGWNSQNQNKDPLFITDEYTIVTDKKRIEALIKSVHDGEELPGIVAVVDARKIVIPDDGMEFLIADSSQIEPRCLNWLAGNMDFLAKVREGFGIYEAFAVAKGRWPAEKKGRLKKEDPKLYQWAKATVLGLGYGCGKAKFVEVARILAGLVITLEESTAIVDDFRATERYVTGLWKKLERAMGCHVGRDFHLQLPSGRVLRYRDVEVEDGGGLSAEIVKTIHGTEKVIRLRYWGGMLTENLVQATAREVFASILLRLEAVGIHVCMHVHDEVVCEVPVLPAERTALKAKVEAIMSATPGFMKGLPLGCEAGFHHFYTK